MDRSTLKLETLPRVIWVGPRCPQGSLKVDQGGRRVRVRMMSREKDPAGHCGLCRWRKGPPAKDCGQSLKSRKIRGSRFSPVPADTPTLAQRDLRQTADLQDCSISYIRVVKAPLSSVIWDSSDRTGTQECGRAGVLAEAPTSLSASPTSQRHPDPVQHPFWGGAASKPGTEGGRESCGV